MPFYTITQTLPDGRTITVADGEVSGDAMAKGLPIAESIPEDRKGQSTEVNIRVSTNAVNWSEPSKVDSVIDPKDDDTVKGK